MIEMQAAIGRIQLGRMPEWHARRAANAQRLAEVCRRFPAVRVGEVPADVTHAWYRFCAFVRPERLAPGWTRDRIIDEIVARGVPCYQGSCSEVYLEKAFDGTRFRPRERLPVARSLGETSLTMLVHPSLTDVQMTRACDVLSEVLRQAGT